jgi:hypothetical protein
MNGKSPVWIVRARRLIRQVFFPATVPYLRHLIRQGQYGRFLIHYSLEGPLLVFDILGLPEIIRIFQQIFKRNARPLADHEMELARAIFQDKIDWERVRIDDDCRIGTRGGKYAFVTYYYINCIGTMTLPVIIHELVHVLQFQQEGSLYAVRNMMAHLFPPTYDYGGLARLQTILATPDNVHSLNYEQRADIFSDYCQLLIGGRPEWGRAGIQDAITYYQVIKKLL